ncbi:MAG: spore germination protein GerW family protein [Bryobacteraceae bacterium]
MPDIKEIAKTTIGEIERMINAKTVVGDPIQVEGATLIPLVSFGFGFGAGGGQGRNEKTGEGDGGGTGGGGGVKPVAVIIASKDGVRVQPIKPGATGLVEKIAESIGNARRARSSESSPEAES